MPSIASRFLRLNKEGVDGTMDHLKARLIANKMNQIVGLDYHETFSSVIKLTSIRIIYVIPCRTNGWKFHQIDIGCSRGANPYALAVRIHRLCSPASCMLIVQIHIWIEEVFPCANPPIKGHAHIYWVY